MSSAAVVILCLDPSQALSWRDQLTAASSLKVGAISNSPSSVRKLVKEHGVDLILVDLRLLEGTRNGALRSLRNGTSEDSPVIMVVTDHADDPLLMDALRGGADSYHVMNGNPFALAEAVQRALDGEAAIEPGIGKQVLDQFERTAPALADDPITATTLQLTGNERQLLLRLAQGITLQAQADAEGVKPQVLGMLARSIYRKLRWNLRASALSLEVDQGFRDSGWAALQPGRRHPRA